MLFNSLEFLFFFPMVVAIYFALPYRFRWVLLLIASYYFYMSWNPSYIVLIMGSTLVDYFCGIEMEKRTEKKDRKKFLYLSLVMNLGLLFFFKYFNFFSDSVNAFFAQFNIFSEIPAFNYLLPVGISFYTFQTLSYSIDVYNGETKAEKHLGIFALYVSFFPQLVAGPIERSSKLLPQFRQKFDINYERIKQGMMLILWGFLLKVVIADRLSEYVDIVYNSPEQFNGLQKLIASYFFAFQIYGDFAGYSYIAIGVALIMGYELMTNFRRPYFSQSIREFWQRWHISLSTWFRDYVYIPLGGNRVVKWRWYYNLFITFLISGLWHGANWTFIIWGALHGFFLVAAIFLKERLFDPSNLVKNKFLNKCFNIFVTFHLVVIAWVFFRISSASAAFPFISDMLNFTSYSLTDVNLFNFPIDFTISVISLVVLLWLEFFEEKYQLLEIVKASNPFVKFGLGSLTLAAIFFLGKFGSSSFIYFQF